MTQTLKNPRCHNHWSEETPETVMAISVRVCKGRAAAHPSPGTQSGETAGGAPSPYLQERAEALVRWKKSEVWTGRGDGQDLTVLGWGWLPGSRGDRWTLLQLGPSPTAGASRPGGRRKRGTGSPGQRRACAGACAGRRRGRRGAASGHVHEQYASGQLQLFTIHIRGGVSVSMHACVYSRSSSNRILATPPR
jgi:hypothetical protein